MTGTFIVSLDCEGKWGMADHIGPEHASITHANLKKAYRVLLDLFDEFETPATFAFVGMFGLTEKQRKLFEPELTDSIYRGRAWTHHYRKAVADGNTDGWFCPEALTMVRDKQVHEIASHGFSHLPFDGRDTPVEDQRREFLLAKKVADHQGIELKTFIFPRNKCAQLDHLVRSGFIGYRTELSEQGGKIGRLCRELNMLDASQADGLNSGGLSEIPAGYFLNWRSGARALVPTAVTANRWRSILKDAAKNAGVAHVWLHPHNIITAPSTLASLRSILTDARLLREQGRLEFKTQAEYAHSIAG